MATRPPDPVPVPESPTLARDAASVNTALALLAAEQNYLLSTRSLLYTESFSRVSTYISALGAATVALGLVIGSTGFASEFQAVTILLLGVVAFLGLTCYLRLTQLNTEDLVLIGALNRLRYAYVEMAPQMRPYLSTSVHDDEQGLMTTLSLGVVALVGGRAPIHSLVTSPAAVAVINCVVLGVVATCALLLSGLVGAIGATVGGVAAFVFAFALHARHQLSTWKSLRLRVKSRFPSPPAPGNASRG